MTRAKILSVVCVAGLMGVMTGDARAVPTTSSLTMNLSDAQGVPIDGPVAVKVRIFDSEAGGIMMWEETHAIVASEGRAFVQLGSTAGNPLNSSVFPGARMWLEFEVAGSTMSPRQPIGSVPYATHAGTSATLGTLSESDVQRLVTGSCPPGESIRAINADGTVICEVDDDGDTTYAAGTGMSLAGTTFSVDTSAIQSRVSGTCAAGEKLLGVNADGTVSCGTDADTDTDTTYSAGAGMSLAGTTFSVDTSAIQSRVTGTCASGEKLLGVNADGTVSCGTDADTDTDTTYSAGAGLNLTGTTLSVDTTQVQSRVTGSCSVGEFVTSVNADGTVTCAAAGGAASVSTDVRRPLNSKETVTSAYLDFEYPAVTVGRDGLAVMCHYTGGTVVTHCSDAACTTHTDTTIGGGGNCSIAIAADGLPRVAYGSGGMKLAVCADVACTAFTTVQLDTNGGASAITIGSDGFPIVAYRNDTDSSVKVAHCDQADCSSVTTTTISTSSEVGLRGVSMAIGIDGLPILAYFDPTDRELDVVHCSTVNCSSFTTESTSTPSTSGTDGNNASIAIGADGLPIISRFNDGTNRLEIWHCSTATCSSMTTITVGSSSAGRYNSIAIGADGKALVSYRTLGSGGTLRLARCADEACTSATEFTLDSTGSTTSLAVGNDGIAHIVYRDTANNRLKLARVPLGRGTRAR